MDQQEFFRQRIEALEKENQKLKNDVAFYEARIENLEQQLQQILFI